MLEQQIQIVSKINPIQCVKLVTLFQKKIEKQKKELSKYNKNSKQKARIKYKWAASRKRFLY
jgi:stalled ribosome alternative rescue factor ArfA